MKAKGKILTVDDDSNNIAIIEELLEGKYDLRIATSGEQALQTAQEFHPDIILLDIMMPGMNGYEVCKRLREHLTTEHTKIIMVSARAMVSERLEGYEAGADDYITKPFDGEEFLEKIKLYLDSITPKANRLSFEIPSTVMKELKDPIIAIKNIISDASSDNFGAISEQLRYQLVIANDCLDIIDSAVSNFHEITEINRPNAAVKLSLFSIQSVILDVIDTIKQTLTLNNGCLNTDLPSDTLLINADRRKIIKILKNLISHAIRGTHEKDNVNISVKDIDGKVCVKIEVLKAEIESNKADKYPNRFDWLRTNVILRRQDECLALVVAEKLSELHGGRICIHYESEYCTVFSFEIPLAIDTKTIVEPVLSGSSIR